MSRKDKNDQYSLQMYLNWLPILLSILFFYGSASTACVFDDALNFSDVKKTSGTLSSPQVEEKIKDFEKRVRIAQQAENEQAARQLGITLADLKDRTEKLRAIQSAYERLLTAVKKNSAQEEVLLREKSQGEEQRGIAQMPPYNLSFYDGIMDELAAAEQQKETLSLAAELSKRALEDVNLRLENARKEWRGLKDQLDSGSQKEDGQHLTWDLEKAQLETELLQALVLLEKANRDNLLMQIEVSELRAESSRRKISWVRDHLHFDEADLVLVREPLPLQDFPVDQLFSSGQLVSDLTARDLDAFSFPDTDAILAHLQNTLRPGDVVAILSNGGFDNIHVRLLDMLQGVKSEE